MATGGDGWLMRSSFRGWRSGVQLAAPVAEFPSPLWAPCGEGQGWGSGIANRFARNLRRNATGAERILWQQLRLLKAEGFHFRRQVPNWDCDNLILLEMARPRDPHPYSSPQGTPQGGNSDNREEDLG